MLLLAMTRFTPWKIDLTKDLNNNCSFVGSLYFNIKGNNVYKYSP